MREERWDEVADTYEQEVLSVFDHDRDGLVREKIRDYGSGSQVASDLGCGLGKFLPELSLSFGAVHACDYSARLLDKASRANAALANVSFTKVDLAAASPRLPRVDFSLCLNVLLTTTLPDRLAMLGNISRQLKRGGHLVLVVPSLESALYANARLVQWNLRSGVSPAEAASAGFPDEDLDGTEVARGGIVYAGELKTKHFIREELIALAEEFRLETVSLEKLEYTWDTEFHEPPDWMGEPFPWDWLAVFRKR